MRENTADKSLFDKKLIKRFIFCALFGIILFVVLCCLFSLAVLKIPSLSDKSFFLAFKDKITYGNIHKLRSKPLDS